MRKFWEDKRVKPLESALQAQVKISDELKEQVDRLSRVNKFLEGESAALRELIAVLKEQLKAETERAVKFQDFWMREFASQQTAIKPEAAGSIFDEDPEIVEEIRRAYSHEVGEL